MKIINDKVYANGEGKSVVLSEKSGKYYFVSSVFGGYDIFGKYQDETMIFNCDEDGNIEDWGEVYVCYPAQHKIIMDKLVSGKLSERKFNK